MPSVFHYAYTAAIKSNFLDFCFLSCYNNIYYIYKLKINSKKIDREIYPCRFLFFLIYRLCYGKVNGERCNTLAAFYPDSAAVKVYHSLHYCKAYAISLGCVRFIRLVKFVPYLFHVLRVYTDKIFASSLDSRS